MTTATANITFDNMSIVATIDNAGAFVKRTIPSETEALIDLFILDISACKPITDPGLIASVYWFTNGSDYPITFGGNTYQPWPIFITGVEQTSNEAPPRPTLSIGNLDVNKLIQLLVTTYGDIVGASLTYIRTFQSYLGQNLEISLPKQKYTIGRKVAHDRRVIGFELRSLIDKENFYLPNRVMLKKDFPGLGTYRSVR